MPLLRSRNADQHPRARRFLRRALSRRTRKGPRGKVSPSTTGAAPATVAEDQGTAYAQLVAEELRGWRGARDTNLQALAQVQQSASLAVSIVAVLSGLSDRPVNGLPLILLIGAAALLVAGALLATIGMTKNRTWLAEPQQLQCFIKTQWADDEVEARYSMITHQVKQMSELDKVCKSLYAWRTAAIWCQSVGLLTLVVGAAILSTV